MILRQNQKNRETEEALLIMIFEYLSSAVDGKWWKL